MYAQGEKQKENKGRVVADSVVQKQKNNGYTLQSVDNRLGMSIPQKQQDRLNGYSFLKNQSLLQKRTTLNPIKEVVKPSNLIQGKFEEKVEEGNFKVAEKYVRDNYENILGRFLSLYKRRLDKDEMKTLKNIIKHRDTDLPTVSTDDMGKLIARLNTIEDVLNKEEILAEVRDLIEKVPKEYINNPDESYHFEEEIKDANLDSKQEFILSIAQKWLDNFGIHYNIVTVEYSDKKENWNIKNDTVDKMAGIGMDGVNESGLEKNTRGMEELTEYNELACCVLQAMPYIYGQDESNSLLLSKQLFLLIRLERLFPGIFPQLNGLVEFTEDTIIPLLYNIFEIKPQTTTQKKIVDLYKDGALRGNRLFVNVPGHALPIEVKGDEVVCKSFGANPYSNKDWLKDRGGSPESLRKPTGGNWAAVLKRVTGQEIVKNKTELNELEEKLKAKVIAGRKR